MRRIAKYYEIDDCNLLILNSKSFVAPPKDGSDLKALFELLTSSGAGRPVDKDGFVRGPWTPALLADALSQTDKSGSGIEMRTVQLWFQDNEKGISPNNIRWLARIFGCDDPDATSEWQVELSAAQRRFVETRRANKATAFTNAANAVSHKLSDTFSLPKFSEKLLGGESTLSLQVSLWALYAGIGLLNFIFGIHSVTYSPVDGLDKQVGFLWAPTWTLLPAVLLPLYVVFVSELLTLWKDNRPRLTQNDEIGWIAKVSSYKFSFWAITIVCVAFVFGFQWFGMYVRIHVQGEIGTFQIDRNMLTLVRPEIISTSKSLLISMLGFLYTALYIWILLVGLLFVYVLALDYKNVCNNQNLENRNNLKKVGKTLTFGIFRCTLIGLWFATCIKLQVVYLSSDGESIVSWISKDFIAALNMSREAHTSLNQQSMTHFTTFLLMVLTFITFCLAIVKIQNAQKQIVPIVSDNECI